MDKNWISMLQDQNQLEKVVETNKYTEKFGLSLTQEQAQLILEGRKNELKEQRRVEFGEGITSKIIFEFCDSDFIDQNNYVSTITRLQEIFYLYKNEMNDEITDEELLHLMREQFDKLCFGDLDYLETTCLANLAKAIRAGYEGYKCPEGYGEYIKLELHESWNYEAYYESLKSLDWGNGE